MNGALKSLQLITGILIGLIGLGAAIGGAGYYFFITQMSTRPPKPVFAEERDGGKPVAIAKAKPKAGVVATTPSPSPEGIDLVEPDKIKPLAPEAYDAKVLWKDGLSLKQDPDPNSEKVGGVEFNAKVAIVETSDDKQWVKIQSEKENLQGWVRAGNIDKAAAAMNEDANPPETTTTPSPKAKVPVKPKPPAEATN
jgi:Bacterial SH3 domain